MAQKKPHKKSSLKTLLIILGVVVVIFVVFIVMNGRSQKAPSGTGLTTQAGGQSVVPGQVGEADEIMNRRSDELVALLRSVSSIELDNSIFSHPSFGRLKSISAPLPVDRNPGRPNPFLPIGHDSTTGLVSLDHQVDDTAATTVLPDGALTGQDALAEFVQTPAEGGAGVVVQ